MRSAIVIGNWHCRFEQIWKMSLMKGSFFVETARCVRRGPFIFYQPPYQFLNHDRTIFQSTFSFPLYTVAFQFFPPQNTLWKEHYSRRIFALVNLQSKHIPKRKVKRFQLPVYLKFINHLLTTLHEENCYEIISRATSKANYFKYRNSGNFRILVS